MDYNLDLDKRISELLEMKADLEAELRAKIAQQNAKLSVNLKNGKICFDNAILERLRSKKIGIWRYISNARLSVILTAPVIYLGLIIFPILHLFMLLYQNICFPIYGIPKVEQRKYFIFDRTRLPYLNALEKFNCAYCSYGNGLLAFSREIAARTEAFWCPLKHYKNLEVEYHEHYKNFAPYGDPEEFRKKYLHAPADKKEEGK